MGHKWRNRYRGMDRGGGSDRKRMIGGWVERGMEGCLVCQKRERYDRKQLKRVLEKTD